MLLRIELDQIGEALDSIESSAHFGKKAQLSKCSMALSEESLQSVWLVAQEDIDELSLRILNLLPQSLCVGL